MKKYKFIIYYKQQFSELKYCFKKTIKHPKINNIIAFIIITLLAFNPIAIYIIYLYDINKTDRRIKNETK